MENINCGRGVIKKTRYLRQHSEIDATNEPESEEIAKEERIRKSNEFYADAVVLDNKFYV